MGQRSERDAALEHLIDVMRFVVGHVFDLEMYVVEGKLGVPAATMPLRGGELGETPDKALPVFENTGQRFLGGFGHELLKLRIAFRVIRTDGGIVLDQHGLHSAAEHLLDAV